MIRLFRKLDLRRIKLNDFSSIDDMRFVFDDDSFYKHTLEVDGKVLAVIGFKRYWGDNWLAFFLISTEMKALHARPLKNFLNNAIIDFGAKRLQTDSVDCPELNKWHKFLGFTLEGTRKKMIHDKDFNMWSILKWE